MHNFPATSSTESFDLTLTVFLIVASLTDVAGALQTPTLSIFLTDEVHAHPAMAGFFPTGGAVIGILVSQFLAGRSDKRGDRKLLVAFCCLLSVLACTLFAWNHNYFVLLFVGIFLNNFGSTANPQMLAPTREHADKTGHKAVMFGSFLRAQISLAWVIGPPLAYTLAMGFSFTVMYLSAAVTFIVYGVMVRLFLPSMQKEPLLTTGAIEAPYRNRRDTLLLSVICALMWGSDSLYIINTPLFTIDELHFPEKLAGMMVGAAAGLEIPAMLIAGHFAKYLGKRFLMRVTAVGGACFYAGMLMAHSPVILLGLQLLSTIFIGILGDIGMLYFQDLMPGQVDSATMLYTNASHVDWIIIGSVAGIIAEIWNYHAMFWFAMVMIIAALFYLLRIKDV